MAVRQGLLGKEAALAIAQRVIDRSPGELTSVHIRGGVSHLTRFCDNYIHQNVSESGSGLSVRVIFGKKIGSASTNALDDESIDRAIEVAAQIARLQKPNEEFQGLPEPMELPEIDAFVPETFDFSALQRAEGVSVIADAAKSKGFQAAGAYSTGASEICIANSLGVRAYQVSTSASLRTVVMSDTGSGYAQGRSRDAREVSPAEIARTATEKCALSENPVSVPAGEYEVVLEPLAVADMLGYLSGGFQGESYQEGRSYLSGKLGQKLFSEKLTVWDDGLDSRGFPTPFDMEGLPKRKVVMIDAGVPTGLFYDYRTARKYGTEPTGGYPGNIFMAPGDATVEEMIKKTKRGILITRFHYTNMAHPFRVLVTGMTRDGTFLIEDGKVTKPVKNFRFTESALRVFSTMDMIGKDAVSAGRAVVPAIRVPAFNFTGVTEF